MRRTVLALALLLATTTQGGVASAQTVLDMGQFLSNQGWTTTFEGTGYPNGPVVVYKGDAIGFRTEPDFPPPLFMERVFATAPADAWASAVGSGTFSVRAEMVIDDRFSYLTDASVGTCQILASTGSVEFYLDFFEDGIELRGGCSGTTYFAMDTTDVIHAYEILATGSSVIVWIDGVEGIEATCPESTTAAEFSFGDMESENFGGSDWYALSFGPAGSVPTEARSWSSVKSIFRQ